MAETHSFLIVIIDALLIGLIRKHCPEFSVGIIITLIFMNAEREGAINSWGFGQQWTYQCSLS